MLKKCKAKVEVFSRVVGFYRPVQFWNRGKLQEYKDRMEYSLYQSKKIQESFSNNSAEALEIINGKKI